MVEAQLLADRPVADQVVRSVTEEDVVRACRLLQPGGDVESLSREVARGRVGLPGDHLAGVDPHARRDAESQGTLELLGDEVDSFPQLDGSP